MSANLLAILELLLVFGLVLWFGISQLRALKRDEPADKADAKRQARSDPERDDPD